MVRYVNVVLTDSLLGNPFAPNRCNVDPLVGAALVSGVGSLLGGIFGRNNNDSTNATNLEIAKMNQQSQREANQMNYQIMKEQNAFNEDMWNKQNAYNDPKANVQRLLNAGINPASGFGQTTPAGSVGAASSAQMNPATLDYQRQPYDLAGNISGAFQGATNAYIQSRLANAEISQKQEQTRGFQLENEEKEKGMMDRLTYLSNMAKREGFLGDLAKTQLEYEVHTFNLRNALLAADYTNALKQVTLNQENINMAKLQNGLYQVQLAYAPKLNEAELKQYYSTIAQIKAQIGLINANKLLTDEQRLHEIEKKTGTIIDTGMKGLDFKIKDATKDFVINSAKEDLYLKEDLRFMRPLDWYQKHLGRAANYTITPGTATAVGEIMDRNNSRDRFSMQHNERFRPTNN